VAPQDVSIYYDLETTYADGGTGGSPAFKWIGIIQDAPQAFENMKLECRGIGSVDPNSFADGLQSPEITLKYAVQRYSPGNEGDFNPATFLAYANAWGVGLGIGWEATYGTPVYMSLWYKGMQIDSLDIDFTIDSFIMATAKLVGHSIVDATALIASAASRETDPIDVAGGYCTPLTGYDAEVFLNAANASDVALTKVKRVHLSIKNNIQRIPVIQTTAATNLKYIRKGKREISGEIVCYIEDKTEYAHLLDATNLDLRVDLHKGDNRPYFDFSDVKLDRGSLTTRISEIPCEVTLPFKALSVSIA